MKGVGNTQPEVEGWIVFTGEVSTLDSCESDILLRLREIVEPGA